MKNWKQWTFMSAFLFMAGISSINAQDLIILLDGNVIEAKVTEISSSEIRYKRFDNQNGPTIVLPTANVLSIRYENGVVEKYNTAFLPEPAPAPGPAPLQAADIPMDAPTTAMDPDKLYWGFYAEPAGFALYGPSISTEWTKGKFNTLLNFRIGALGLLKDSDFGVGWVVNYFHPSRLGGFYVGGMLEYSTGKYEYWREGYRVSQWYWDEGHGYWDPNDGIYHEDSAPQQHETGYDVPSGYQKAQAHNFGIALSMGYKFVLSSGIYFRTGGYVGITFSNNKDGGGFLFRPELTFGYNF